MIGLIIMAVDLIIMIVCACMSAYEMLESLLKVTTQLAKGVSAIAGLAASFGVSSVPGFEMPNIADLDKLQSGQISELIIKASKMPIVRDVIGSQIPGVSFLEIDANGKLRDLFDDSSTYNGMPAASLAKYSKAENGMKLPILMLDAARVKQGTEIRSAGPIFVYGQATRKLNVQSNVAIIFGNEQLQAEGTVLDAPIVIAGQLDEGSGIQIKNSMSANGHVKVIPFADVKNLAKGSIQKVLNGEPLDHSFSFDGVGAEIESLDVPPAPTVSQIWQSTKCETGFIFIRCHLRFNREVLQGFINQFATQDFTRQDVSIAGMKFNVGVNQPRLSLTDKKVRILMDVSLKNLNTSGITIPSASSDGWLSGILNYANIAHQTVAQAIPELSVRNVEVVIDGFRYDRRSGQLFVKSAHIGSFDLTIPFLSAEQNESFKDVAKTQLNEFLTRYLVTTPVYNLNDVKVFGVRLAKLLLEKVDVESPDDILHMQLHAGFFGRNKNCEENLLEIVE
jgi:hypothetical protein